MLESAKKRPLTLKFLSDGAKSAMAESEIYFKIVSAHQGGKVLEAFLSHDTANASIEAFNIFTTNALLLQEKRNSDGQLWYWSGIEIKNKIHPFLGLYLNNGTIRGSYLKKLVAQRHDDSDSQREWPYWAGKTQLVATSTMAS